MPSPMDRLIKILPSLSAFHAPSSPIYEFMALVADEHARARFGEHPSEPSSLEPFGQVHFPFHRMGAVDSVDLFGLNELILFAFYWVQRQRYHKVLDIGANLGLHSIVMERCGFEVRCYEPDPEHFRILQCNLALNACHHVVAINAAVSSEGGEAEFVRVLGNTTSSHLAGSKGAPYGDLQRFTVQVESFGPLLGSVDLVKLDVEGHEAQIICATTSGNWKTTDMVLEVGSVENARRVFDHCRSLGVRMFAQKSGWLPVTTLAEMPVSYRDGGLFASARHEGPWS